MWNRFNKVKLSKVGSNAIVPFKAQQGGVSHWGFAIYIKKVS
jgi:hypothetical protein